MKNKIFVIMTIASIGFIITLISAIIIWVDPFFHYHKPIEGLTYPLYSERYQNNGIVRHFDYDAIITGTSMTENFKASECDALFGTHAVKVPFSGGYLNEIDANLKRAFSENCEIKLVVRSLEWGNLVNDKDAWNDIYTYPYYLYDDNVFNDVSYVFNKTVFLSAIGRLLKNEPEDANTTFDDYEYWSDRFEYGKEAVRNTYVRPEISLQKTVLSMKEKVNAAENMEYNILDTVKANPETTFYIFFPPYSVAYWDIAQREGKLDYSIELQKIAIEAMLPYDNVKIFSFCHKKEWVTNLDNYIDANHYSGKINSDILRYMADDSSEYLITKENYMVYIDEIREFYSNYDYEKIYE